jgi:PPOX class probable F420-dependent enzyme
VPDLPESVARSRFAAASVARLATVDEQGRPHLVPIAFVVDRDRIYTAVDRKPKTTRNLQRLANIRANPYVAVLVDHYEDDWMQLWWVRADGRASIIDSIPEMTGPLGLLAQRYRQYGEQTPEGPVICIDVDRWRGWAYTVTE